MERNDLIAICHMRQGSRCKDCIAYGRDQKGHDKECNRFKSHNGGKTPWERYGPNSNYGKMYCDRPESIKIQQDVKYKKVRKELHERYR